MAVRSLHGTVSVIDTGLIGTSTNPVIAQIQVGGDPVSLALNPAGTRAYVARASANAVSVIDTATNAVIATVPVGQDPGAVVATATRAYVTNVGSGTVSVIDIA
ncbi:MAG: hypothetical protein FGM52_17250 [Mycobacterium sp.]|nr:hypothetical protein [Mycobacterium sp.]